MSINFLSTNLSYPFALLAYVRRVAVIVIALCWFSCSAFGQVSNFTGSSSQQWEDGGNWTNGIPGIQHNFEANFGLAIPGPFNVNVGTPLGPFNGIRVAGLLETSLGGNEMIVDGNLAVIIGGFIGNGGEWVVSNGRVIMPSPLSELRLRTQTNAPTTLNVIDGGMVEGGLWRFDFGNPSVANVIAGPGGLLRPEVIQDLNVRVQGGVFFNPQNSFNVTFNGSTHGLVIGNLGNSNLFIPTQSVGTLPGFELLGNSENGFVYSTDRATLGSLTAIFDSTLEAVNGLRLAPQTNLFVDGSIVGSLILESGSSLSVGGTSSINGPIEFGGISCAGSIDIGSSTLTLITNAVVPISGEVMIDHGILNAASGLALEETATLLGAGDVNAKTSAGPLSMIAGSTGQLKIGDLNQFNGFVSDGMICTTSIDSSIVLCSQNLATIGGVIVLNDGEVAADNGIAMDAGAVLIGSGSCNSRIAGQTGSSIEAAGGDLMLGRAELAAFFHDGEMYTNDHQIIIVSNNRATLGSLTVLGDSSAGIIDIQNGAFLDFGRVISGYGSINGTNTLAQSFIINGDVVGNSEVDRIEFNGYVKGVGTFTNATVNGTFSPGLSPTLTLANNFALGSTSTLEMEIGGTQGGSQHDKIVDQGNLNLDGILKVVLINGFQPQAGDVFDVLDWSNLNGKFSAIDLSSAELAAGLSWNTDSLYTSGTLSVVADILLGDVNQDGVVNLLDVEPFIALLSAGGFQAEADINQDGVINLLDIEPFIALLSG